MELLGADRIDHGVRAIEDASLVAMLAERQIPLGICPTSNLVLGVYASIEQHPVERLRAAGVRVSINTDDPALLGASLVGEYGLCRNAFNWSDRVTQGRGAHVHRGQFRTTGHQGGPSGRIGRLVSGSGWRWRCVEAGFPRFSGFFCRLPDVEWPLHAPVVIADEGSASASADHA